MRRYLIVGSGVAGIAAAESIRSQDAQGHIQIVGDEPQGYYSRPGLAFLLSGEISEQQLFPMTKKDFDALQVDIKYGRVTAIDARQHLARLQDGNMIPYDRLLIAGGAEAAMPQLAGLDLEGVVKLDSLNDANRIIQKMKRARTSIVVGGGITALELVEGLVHHGVKTAYLLRGGRYWKSVLDEDESLIVESRVKNWGVDIQYHVDITRILGKKGRVSGVELKDGRRLACDLLCIAVGIRPRTWLAQRSGIAVDRGILVNECLETSSQDIFAAGDAAQVYDPQSGKYLSDSLWGPAREQGSVAGLVMSGCYATYNKYLAFNVTRLAGLTTTIIGAMGRVDDEDILEVRQEDCQTWRELPNALVVQSGFDVNHLRVMVGEKTLSSAILVGDQKLSQPLHELIAGQVDITPIRERILEAQAPLADMIIDYWLSWKQVYAIP
jgi:NAD(P)H-nitrite reductase large subunit